MAEPHSTTVGILLGTGIGLTGTVLGAQVDALLIGLIAAIIISIWMPKIDGKGKAAAAVAMSSLLAGYGSPVAAVWLAGEQHGLTDGQPLRMLLAVCIGAVAPTLVPLAVERLRLIVGGAKA